jgi:hypothetical protein
MVSKISPSLFTKNAITTDKTNPEIIVARTDLSGFINHSPVWKNSYC